MYFSFITLTTVGYGDLTPYTDVARTAAVCEAVLGQVFLVTAVARIVSLLGSSRSDRSDPRLEPAPAHRAGAGPRPRRRRPPRLSRCPPPRRQICRHSRPIGIRSGDRGPG